MKNIQAGDVVKVKSGGVRMTVEFIRSTSVPLSADVIWITSFGERRTAVIAAVALKKAK